MAQSNPSLPLLGTVFVCGACVMTIEMSASRLLQPHFGSSVYVWTNIIAVIMAGLALGYYFGGRTADRFPEPRVLHRLILSAGLLVLVVPLFSSAVQSFFLPAFGDLPPRGAHREVVLGSLASTVILFVIPILLLGAIPPFAVKLLTQAGKPSGAASGQILMVSTLGSILGTFIPAHLSIPTLGTRLTYIIAGGVLFLVGAMGAFRKKAIPLILLPVGLGFLCEQGPIRATVDSIYETESSYQYINVLKPPSEPAGTESVVLTLDEGVRDYQSLYIPGNPLTGGLYFDYYILLPWLLPTDDPLDILILGAGAGTITRSLLQIVGEERIASIDAVEIDPKVIEVGSLYFDADFGPESKAVSREADGRFFLQTTTKSYDLIIVDAYANQVYIPFHFTTKEFFSLVHKRLRPHGILGMNVSTFSTNSPLFGSIARSLTQAFSTVYRTPIFGGTWNQMIFAPRETLHRTWDDLTTEAIPDPLHVVYRRARDLTQPLLTSGSRAEVLTDDWAPVEQYLNEELSNQEPSVLPLGDQEQEKTPSVTIDLDPEASRQAFQRFSRLWEDDERENAFNEFLLAYSLDPAGQDYSGYAYGTFLQDGEIRLAQRFFETAIEREPDNLDVLYYRGWSLFELGDVSRAATVIERVVRTEGNNKYVPAAWSFLGTMRFVLGDLGGAKTAYHQHATHDPDDPGARAALESLARIEAGRPRQAAAFLALLALLSIGYFLWRKWIGTSPVDMTTSPSENGT